MYLVGTKNGLYEVKGKVERVCCDGEEVYDFLLRGKDLYVCSADSGVTLNGKKLLDDSCWRLYEYNGKLFALVEGVGKTRET